LNRLLFTEVGKLEIEKILLGLTELDLTDGDSAITFAEYVDDKPVSCVPAVVDSKDEYE
jgi:hypothetical protein